MTKNEFSLAFKKKDGSNETLHYDNYERALTSFGYFYWGRNIDWSEYQQVILMENDQVLRCAEERKLTITSDGQTTVHDYSNRKSSS